jgi:hypothetical protein
MGGRNLALTFTFWSKRARTRDQLESRSLLEAARKRCGALREKLTFTMEEHTIVTAKLEAWNLAAAKIH